MNYEEPGYDYNNHPLPEPPGFLSCRGQKIFSALARDLLAQAREGHISNKGKGIAIFRDGYLEFEGRISVSQLAEAIQLVLPKEEECSQISLDV